MLQLLEFGKSCGLSRRFLCDFSWWAPEPMIEDYARSWLVLGIADPTE